MIDRIRLAAMLPHAGAMCLLEQVIDWDATRILCSTISHRDAGNPMARHGRLEAVCGVEYAAQAMAVHGALTGSGDAPPRLGYLASLRDVTCHVARLDLLDDLMIEAELLLAQSGRVIYRFTLRSDGQDILSGRAAVVLDGDAP
jgi:predicted hotdog family 3-hydroxylacyl-ACP dehydratase